MNKSQKCVRKAVITAGGFGTRLFPATKAVQKELFPVVDSSGRAKPVILALVEEALSAGIESIAIVTQPSTYKLFENFFQGVPQGVYYEKLLTKYPEYIEYLQNLGARVTIIVQDVQEGFGHAVYCAKDWIQDEYFLLLLGDHVFVSNNEISCAKQVLDIFRKTQTNVIAVKATQAETIAHQGCVTGAWQESGLLLNVTQICEKPTVEYALQHLCIPGMSKDQLLSVFGMYVISPQIFTYLSNNITRNFREWGEFQLTSCLDELRQDLGMLGYLVEGRSFDVGLPDLYVQAVIGFRQIDHC